MRSSAVLSLFLFWTGPSALRAAELTAPQGEPANLEVRVAGIQDIAGEVGVAVFNQKDGYPIQIAKSYEAQWQPQKGQKELLFVFDSLPAGDYAVSVLHDENGDKKLQTSAVGFPKEGVGFSNGQKVVMSAPKFRKAKFALAAGEKKRIDIPMDYRHRPKK